MRMLNFMYGGEKNKVSDCVKHPVMMQAVLFVPDDVADDSCLVCKEGV